MRIALAVLCSFFVLVIGASAATTYYTVIQTDVIETDLAGWEERAKWPGDSLCPMPNDFQLTETGPYYIVRTAQPQRAILCAGDYVELWSVTIWSVCRWPNTGPTDRPATLGSISLNLFCYFTSARPSTDQCAPLEKAIVEAIGPGCCGWTYERLAELLQQPISPAERIRQITSYLTSLPIDTDNNGGDWGTMIEVRAPGILNPAEAQMLKATSF